jgi:hypothetical protein
MDINMEKVIVLLIVCWILYVLVFCRIKGLPYKNKEFIDLTQEQWDARLKNYREQQVRINNKIIISFIILLFIIYLITKN